MNEDFNNLPGNEKTETKRLGEALYDSPILQHEGRIVVEHSQRVLIPNTVEDVNLSLESGAVPSFEASGARSKIYFDPNKVRCGIVTCGGLCPGLNNVIRSLVRSLKFTYGVDDVIGFRYGYKGLGPDSYVPPIDLTLDVVEDIHRFGGTLLGSCRGTPGVDVIVDSLVHHHIDILFTIGGDGTLRGASAIAAEILRRDLKISIIGIPKTIDNDLQWVDRSFGFSTAVEEASRAVIGAHEEARGAWNGIGLVKLMGRHSGFIATHTTLANQEANFCLLPEIPFDLEGENGFYSHLKERLERKHHAVIVVAEGAGQDLVSDPDADQATDASGNKKLKNIGRFLKEAISDHLTQEGIDFTLKYIDPSYIVRSLPAGTMDSELCATFAHHAVHAGMAGKTDVYIGTHNQRFIDVPIALGVGTRKQVVPSSQHWRRVIEATGQPVLMKN